MFQTVASHSALSKLPFPHSVGEFLGSGPVITPVSPEWAKLDGPERAGACGWVHSRYRAQSARRGAAYGPSGVRHIGSGDTTFGDSPWCIRPYPHVTECPAREQIAHSAKCGACAGARYSGSAFQAVASDVRCARSSWAGPVCSDGWPDVGHRVPIL